MFNTFHYKKNPQLPYLKYEQRRKNEKNDNNYTCLFEYTTKRKRGFKLYAMVWSL